MLPNSGSKPPARSTENSQPVDRAMRKPQNVERMIPRDVRESVVARLTIHGKTPQKVARESGLSQREIIDVLLEHKEIDTRKRVQRAYNMGRASWLPPADAKGKAA